MSPFSPYGPTIALVFVLLVAAGKAIIEDMKRHKEDRITNNSTAHVVQADGKQTRRALSLGSSVAGRAGWRANRVNMLCWLNCPAHIAQPCVWKQYMWKQCVLLLSCKAFWT